MQCTIALPNDQTPNNRVEYGTCLEAEQRRVFPEHILSSCDHGGQQHSAELLHAW